MKLHIFSARKVVQDLSRDEISHEHRAYYLLAGFVFSLIIGHCTLTGTNASRTWLGFYEFLILLLITVYGFSKCYFVANGNTNSLFVSDFICISLPVGVTTTFWAWLGYWGGWWIFHQIFLSQSFDSLNSAKMVVWINNELPWFSIIITMVASTGFFYARMISHLTELKILRKNS